MPDTLSLAEALRDFYIRIHRDLDRRMAAGGVSLARTKLLAFIRCRGDARSADIVAAFGHAPRTVTEAIDGLERDGLVRREPHPADRRAKRILITEAGEAAIAASEPIYHELVERVFGPLSPSEREALAAVMAKLIGNLGSAESDPDSP
ncbi:MAG TPA: MarR family transcriptional regulator [Sphingomonas sp.]|nr:MarR family transcriptional regulator [Sphingomonas sp.]